MGQIGNKPLRELAVEDVRVGLEALSDRLSTRYLQIARRPSRSLTPEQSLALLKEARESRLNAYVVLSLTVGIRTEEGRELRWDHVDLDGDPGAVRPVPPSVAVWRSVRHGGDTKTAKSRRTLALPQAVIQALKEHRRRQSEDQLAVGAVWQEHGLVFVSSIGTPLDASNVRREFRNHGSRRPWRGMGAPGSAPHLRIPDVSGWRAH
jgi:integrase